MSAVATVVDSLAKKVRAVALADRSRAGSVLIILGTSPTDGDATWNALRLVGALLGQGVVVRVFVMNDAIDLVRQGAMREGAEFDLQAMLRELLARGARIKVCTTCVTRCGLHSGDVLPEAVLSSMADLAAWVVESDRVVTC